MFLQVDELGKERIMSSKREIWVDYIKVLACVLVVLGHFFQSMVKADIFPETKYHLWFDTTIYYFHVPLFFICSGYLYQKYSQVVSWESWRKNVVKKVINLGIPYFVFSILTWILKTLFADLTSNAIGGIVEVLFINPYSPYWYLYVLFIIFLLIPTMQSGKSLGILLAIAVIMKAIICALPRHPLWEIYAMYGLFSFTIWFVLGMGLAVIGSERIKGRALGFVLIAVFIGLSIYTVNYSNDFIEFGMAVMACTGIFMTMVLMKGNNLLDKLAPYTMPVYLMHTLIAAPVRIALVKIGMMNSIIHVVAGLIASFVGPVIAIKIMAIIKLDVLVNPGKYIRIKA